MECQEAQALIPGYLDGELSDTQAAPLRQHLIDCSSCRLGMQDSKNLGAWFVDDVDAQDTLVPAGFAARVARRAMAGDTGSLEIPTAAASQAAPSAGLQQGRIFDFVLQLTAAAAVLLFVVTLLTQQQGPAGVVDLKADDNTNLQRVLERLDDLNGDLTHDEASEDREPSERDDSQASPESDPR